MASAVPKSLASSSLTNSNSCQSEQGGDRRTAAWTSRSLYSFVGINLHPLMSTLRSVHTRWPWRNRATSRETREHSPETAATPALTSRSRCSCIGINSRLIMSTSWSGVPKLPAPMVPRNTRKVITPQMTVSLKLYSTLRMCLARGCSQAHRAQYDRKFQYATTSSFILALAHAQGPARGMQDPHSLFSLYNLQAIFRQKWPWSAPP